MMVVSYYYNILHEYNDSIPNGKISLYAHAFPLSPPDRMLWPAGVEFDDPTRGKHDGAVEKPDVSYTKTKKSSSRMFQG